VVESIRLNVGPEVIEAFSPVVVQPESTPKKYREPTLADLANGPIACEYRDLDEEHWRSGFLVHILNGAIPFLCVNEQQELSGQWDQCRIEEPVDPIREYVASVKQERRDALMASIADRPVPKGFRLLGHEPRLASDGYWSPGCKDCHLIGDRVEAANRFMWPAIRFVVDEPEPVKQFVLVCDHEISDQALYVDGILQDFDETIYGTNIAKLAKGSLIRFDSYEVSAPEQWPRGLSDLGKLGGKQLEDPSGEWGPTYEDQIKVEHPGSSSEGVSGSYPIKASPIMQIRLPFPASVLGKLGDMLEKHYPGSTMRQVGGYLVFEEPIES
jgi:hypothetical protein